MGTPRNNMNNNRGGGAGKPPPHAGNFGITVPTLTLTCTRAQWHATVAVLHAECVRCPVCLGPRCPNGSWEATG